MALTSLICLLLLITKRWVVGLGFGYGHIFLFPAYCDIWSLTEYKGCVGGELLRSRKDRSCPIRPRNISLWLSSRLLPIVCELEVYYLDAKTGMCSISGPLEHAVGNIATCRGVEWQGYKEYQYALKSAEPVDQGVGRWKVSGRLRSVAYFSGGCSPTWRHTCSVDSFVLIWNRDQLITYYSLTM